MITIKEAIDKYKNEFPDFDINEILDVGKEWVISSKSKEDGSVPYTSPIAISKENGDMRVFFPPQNKELLENAKEVDISNI